MTIGKKTQLAKVLTVLEEGPTTAHECAAETSLSVKHCSAYLTTLLRDGIVKIMGRQPHEPCDHCGRKAAGVGRQIYQLVNQAGGAA